MIGSSADGQDPLCHVFTLCPSSLARRVEVGSMVPCRQQGLWRQGIPSTPSAMLFPYLSLAMSFILASVTPTSPPYNFGPYVGTAFEFFPMCSSVLEKPEEVANYQNIEDR